MPAPANGAFANPLAKDKDSGRGAGRVAWGNELIRDTGEVLPIDFASRASVGSPELTPAASLAGRWLPQRESLRGAMEAINHLTAAGQAALQGHSIGRWERIVRISRLMPAAEFARPPGPTDEGRSWPPSRREAGPTPRRSGL